MTAPARPDESAAGGGEIETELLSFLLARTGAAVSAEVDLFASGAITSLFAMELVVHLEQAYGVVIAGRDLRMDNFRTVTAMAELVRSLRTIPVADREA